MTEVRPGWPFRELAAWVAMAVGFGMVLLTLSPRIARRLRGGGVNR